METIKDMVIMKITTEISKAMHVDSDAVKNIITANLGRYSLIDTEGVSKASDILAKVDFFIGVRRLDGLSDHTLKQYRFELGLFARNVNKSVADITANDLRGYLTRIQKNKPFEKTTLNNKINVLKTFFKFLYTEDIIPADPSKKLKTQRVDLKSLRDALQSEEIELLRNSCAVLKEKLLIEFFLCTGCRLSEAIGIRLPEINWVERAIIVHGKGSKIRTVYFSVRCKMLMQEYLIGRSGKSEALFIGDRAPFEPLTKSGIEKAIKRIAQRTTITKSVSPHVLRHTFATNALARGMTLELIQKLLGHSNISTTQIYAETSQRAVKAAYEQYVAA